MTESGLLFPGEKRDIQPEAPDPSFPVARG